MWITGLSLHLEFTRVLLAITARAFAAMLFTVVYLAWVVCAYAGA